MVVEPISKNNHKKSLYIIATPIGNMRDITLRAIDILQDCDIILCENPINSINLLKHYNIKKAKISSYNDHSNHNKRAKILSQINDGNKIALISDAGTPLISDPGYKLVNYLQQFNIDIIPIPGPSSLTATICASGLACDHFTFLGFLPKNNNKKRDVILANITNTIIFFESARTILDTLLQIFTITPNRNCCIAREITKIYEEIITDKLENIILQLQKEEIAMKGEFVIIIEKSLTSNEISQDKIIKEIKKLKKQQLSLKDITNEISKNYNLSKKNIYKIALNIN